MNPAPNQLYQDNMAERGMDSDDSNRMPNESPLAHPRAFSAGAWWFLGMMLLVAGSTVAMQGVLMIGVVVLIAGIATVTAAAVALMS